MRKFASYFRFLTLGNRNTYLRTENALKRKIAPRFLSETPKKGRPSPSLCFAFSADQSIFEFLLIFAKNRTVPYTELVLPDVSPVLFEHGKRQEGEPPAFFYAFSFAYSSMQSRLLFLTTVDVSTPSLSAISSIVAPC